MSGVDPKFQNDYAMIRAYRALYFWCLEHTAGPRSDPAEKPGLLHAASRCRRLMDKLDPDKSKRREMDADIERRRTVS